MLEEGVGGRFQNEQLEMETLSRISSQGLNPWLMHEAPNLFFRSFFFFVSVVHTYIFFVCENLS